MKQPRKAQLRRQIERLTRQLDTERERTAHAESLRAFDHQLVDFAQAKLQQVEHWVREIVDILNNHSPASALLPRELQTRRVPEDTDFVQVPALHRMYYEEPATLNCQSPATLAHLKMFLEDNPESWNRVISVHVQDRTSNDPTFRHSLVHHAISREYMYSLLRDKNHFIEFILHTMGTQLFHHLNKTK